MAECPIAKRYEPPDAILNEKNDNGSYDNYDKYD